MRMGLLSEAVWETAGNAATRAATAAIERVVRRLNLEILTIILQWDKKRDRNRSG